VGAVLEPITFDHARFEAELTALEALLASKDDLSETDDIGPLFKVSRQLSAFLGPSPRTSDRRPSWPSSSGSSATTGPTSSWEASRPPLLRGRVRGRGPRQHLQEAADPIQPEWSARFEHGFSQLTDWFFNLDDYKKTHGFTKTFGYGHVSFTGLLIIGGRRAWTR